MKKADKKLWKIVGMGLVAGMRTFVGPAAMAHYFSQRPRSVLNKSKLKFIQSPVTANITKVLAIIEFGGDKLPASPNRTDAGGLIGRVAAGALSGAVLATRSKDDVLKGVLLGGVSAAAATFGFFYLRKFATEKCGVPNAIAGAVEDALAVSTAVCILKK